MFPDARKPLSDTSIATLLRRMDRGGLIGHGFESCFRDWCAVATAHPREVTEQALAHAPPDKVEAAYRRGDMLEKRRRLIEDWDDFCTLHGRFRVRSGRALTAATTHGGHSGPLEYHSLVRC